MDRIWQDLRFSLRALRKTPGFTAIAVVTLALGMGANSAIFSVINSVLFRPLPVSHPAEMAVLEFQHGHGHPEQAVSYLEYEHLRQQADSPFSGVVGWELGTAGVRIDNKNYQLLVNYVPPGFFQTLAVEAAYGRVLLPSEGKTPGQDPVVVLGYGYWHGRLGGDPNIVGKKILVNQHPFTVVGVTPEQFHGLQPLLDVQAYLPYAMGVTLGGPQDLLTNTKNDNVHVYARLKPGVTIPQARAALAVEADRLSVEFPDRDKGLTILVFSERLSRPDPQSSAQFIAVSGLFLALSMLVLVLACVNVANLLLVRATVRRREMAIRVALGGARARLVRLLLTESVLLALLGGAAGVLMGAWSSNFIQSINLHTTLPVAIDFSFDWRVFGFSFLAALLTGVLVGLVPAVRASRTDLVAALRESGRSVARGRHRLRNMLVTVQVAGSLTLLVVAMLFARSMIKAQHVDVGFRPQGLVNLTMDPTGLGYAPQQTRDFFDQLLTRVRALPGVESASLAFAVPFGYYNAVTTLEIEGYQPPPKEGAPMLYNNYVSAGYFQNLGIPLVSGRDFNEADREDAQRVAIVNQAAAKKFWANQQALGQHFKLHDDKEQHPVQVIAIARDSRYDDFSGPVEPFIYLPFAQYSSERHDFGLRTLQVRTGGDPMNMVPTLRKTIEEMAPALPVFDVHTMMDGLETLNGLLIFKLGAGLAAAMGLLGLALAIVGVYGVVSYATNQRTLEIGIRVALGAEPAEIVRLVLKQGLWIVLLGVGLGLAFALAAGRVVGQFLVGISTADPLTFVSVSVILASVALLACWVPARRALRVDPAVALRHE